jgi:hypothetical protein
MIIQDKIIRADGTIEQRDIEVADTYLDPPEIVAPKPTLEEQIAELKATIDTLTTAMTANNFISTAQFEQITGQAYTA